MIVRSRVKMSSKSAMRRVSPDEELQERAPPSQRSARAGRLRSTFSAGGDMGEYDRVYRRSLDDPNGFWAEAARAIDWVREPPVVLDDTNEPFYRWYSGGELNTSFNALDRHVE